jgi:two-component system, NarL family, invasion response regulator UvrY
MAATKAQLLLVDDHSVLRAGLRYVLSEFDDIEIAAEAASVRETLEALELKVPDLVLLDISLPDGSGLEALTLIKREYPGVRVVMLSNHSANEFAAYALSQGADAYVTKAGPTKELVATIRRVLKDR